MAYINGNDDLLIALKGDNAFIRYSAYADGTDFTEEWSVGQNYIGFATGQTAPTDKSAYEWITISVGDAAEIAAREATETAREEVERFVGELGVVQNTGDSLTAVMSQKSVTDIFMGAFGKVCDVSFDGVEKKMLYNLNALTGFAHNNYDTYYKSVTSGETFLISSKVVTTNASYVAMFYDESGNFLNGEGNYSTDVGAEVNDYPVVAPPNAVLMRVSTYAGEIPSLKTSGVYPLNLHEVLSSAFEKKLSVAFDSVEKGICYGQYVPNGYASAAYDTYNKAVTAGEKFFLSSSLVQGGYYAAATFWGADGAFVAEVGNYNDVGASVADYPVSVPLNAVLMRVSTLADHIPELNTTDIVYGNVHNIETNAKKYFVKFDGNECYIKTRYNNSEDIVFKLHKPTDHGNGLPDFERVYTVTRSEPMNKSLLEFRNIFSSRTDMFMPIKVGVLNNIDGDFTSSYFFTGGNHRSDNSGTGGTPTARCTVWKVFADGRELSNEGIYANDISTHWTNLIQAFNTTKADGSGREVIREDIRLTFEGTKINVETIHTALEKVYRTLYYGIGAVKGNFTTLFFAGSKVNRAAATITDTSALNSGDKNCRDMILSTDNGDKMCVHLDSIDLGDLSNVASAYSAFNSNGKCYFSVIDSTFNQNQGEKTILRGYYEFYTQ